MFRLSIVQKVSAVAVAIAFGTTSVWALTAEQEAKLLASDGAPEDLFGLAVAIDGDTALIGAYLDDDNGSSSGAAYVFARTAGVWTEQAKLLASDGAANDQFGNSLTLDGDTAIIGAWRTDGNGPNTGSAYVFTRTAGAWTEQAKLVASDGSGHELFGKSVALHADTAVIGAAFDNDNGFDSGSAYVFTRTAGVWTEQAKLLPSDGAEHDFFGLTVAIYGDTALVGAFRDDDNGFDSGSAYVFTRTGSTWTEQAKLLASDGSEFDFFGYSVALHADTAVIGAFQDDDNGFQSGSAYVLIPIGNAWWEQAKLLASDGAAQDHFGRRVALNGDIALIGAEEDDDNGSESGSAYVFTHAAGPWAEQAKLLPADGSDFDRFGFAVAIDGDTALVGAHGDDDNGSGSGSAYVFRLFPDDDGDVPAARGIGAVLLLLTMLGAGVYFGRRRATS